MPNSLSILVIKAHGNHRQGLLAGTLPHVLGPHVAGKPDQRDAFGRRSEFPVTDGSSSPGVSLLKTDESISTRAPFACPCPIDPLHLPTVVPAGNEFIANRKRIGGILEVAVDHSEDFAGSG